MPHHAVEIHAGPVREDQARPNDDSATLAIGDTVVVLSGQARALRNQQILTRRRVVDILAHDSLDLTRQVGVYAAFKRCRNVPSRLDFIIRERRRSRCGRIIPLIPGLPCLFNETFFVLLEVRITLISRA